MKTEEEIYEEAFAKRMAIRFYEWTWDVRAEGEESFPIDITTEELYVLFLKEQQNEINK